MYSISLVHRLSVWYWVSLMVWVSVFHWSHSQTLSMVLGLAEGMGGCIPLVSFPDSQYGTGSR